MAIFDKSLRSYQFVVQYYWILELYIHFTLGIDGISILYSLLRTMLIPLCLLHSWENVKFNLQCFLNAFLLLYFLLIGTLCTMELYYFIYMF